MHKIGLTIFLGDFYPPLFLERLDWTGEETQRIAGLLKRLNMCRVELTPYRGLLSGLLGSRYAFNDRSALLQQFIGCTLLEQFAQVIFVLERSLEVLIILDKSCCFLRDMYDTQVTELRQERLVITMEHQEGVFFHL